MKSNYYNMDMTDAEVIKIFRKAQLYNRKAKNAKCMDERLYFYNLKTSLIESVVEMRPELCSVFEVDSGIIGIEIKGVGGLHITFKELSSKALSYVALLMRRKNWHITLQ